VIATRPFTFFTSRAQISVHNSRQGYAACSTLKPADCFFPVNTPAKPMATSVGTLFISDAQLAPAWPSPFRLRAGFPKAILIAVQFVVAVPQLISTPLTAGKIWMQAWLSEIYARIALEGDQV